MIRLLAHRYAMLAATICLCRISIGGDCSLLATDGSVAVFERLKEVSDGLALKDRFEQMYSDLAARQVKPAGWIREFLERQRTGLTGHPEQSGFPFNTQMWAGEMNVRDREHSADGSDWWPYEQTAYYLDGALLFSLPVQAKQMLITDDAGVGKCSPEFPMYCLEP